MADELYEMVVHRELPLDVGDFPQEWRVIPQVPGDVEKDTCTA